MPFPAPDPMAPDPVARDPVARDASASHPAAPGPAAIEELRAGLSRPLPEIPCKHFYDERGSLLFDRITRLPEYYPTRTEEGILEREADRIVRAARCRDLAELGSGAGRKIRLLLDAVRRSGSQGGAGLRQVLLMDVSRQVLVESVERLEAEYPEAQVIGLVGDFERDLAKLGPGGERLVLFLAGTVGNLHPASVPSFLRRVAAQMEGGDHFLVGVDLVKAPRVLHAAYNDAEGVTAEFNRNILRVVNRRFGADFEPEAFEHVAFWDPTNGWIEMRLRATRAMRVRLEALGVSLFLGRGEEIRTELSCKYTREGWLARCRATGLAPAGWFTDPEGLFALALLRRMPEPRP
jgi:L-histidine N-alpha-methyltransferase